MSQSINKNKVKIVVDSNSQTPIYMNLSEGIYIKHENDNFKISDNVTAALDIVDFVIRKYTKVEDVKITSQTNQNLELLEVEVILGK